MEGTFREWLQKRVGGGDGQVSRRELARRLTEKYASDFESQRSSLRRILVGDRVASQRTRDAIQDVLDDHTAPSVDDEAADEATARERKIDSHLNAIRNLALGRLV